VLSLCPLELVELSKQRAAFCSVPFHLRGHQAGLCTSQETCARVRRHSCSYCLQSQLPRSHCSGRTNSARRLHSLSRLQFKSTKALFLFLEGGEIGFANFNYRVEEKAGLALLHLSPLDVI
jgi:hypothetical protein